MSRRRQTKPNFLHSHIMARVSRNAQPAFIRLWLPIDDAGRTGDGAGAAPEALMNRSGTIHETRERIAADVAPRNEPTPILANSGAIHEALAYKPSKATSIGALPAFS